MKSCQWFTFSLALACACIASQAFAQSPSAIYTWDNTGNAMPNVENWVKNFGTNTVALDNSIAGALRIVESGGGGTDVALSDGANRVRESSTAASGGTDVTGLDWMEFDLGHNGSGPIQVQFYVQASTAFSFVALGPDVLVTPGMNTYQVPLTALTPNQAVYLRTMGFNARTHADVGDVTWILEEVRAGGTPLKQRTLITHDTGVTPEGGLQGAFVNFGNTAVQGNDGGQNQTGLSHDSSGTGSLEFTSLGAAAGTGGAISWGNGTALNGNTFNNRTMDISNYEYMTITLSATDPNNAGGTLGFNTFVQRNNFQFQGLTGSGSLPIDGQFHEFSFPLAGITNLNVTDVVGLNLFDHDQNLIINVDSIRFKVPEPASLVLLGIAIGCFSLRREQRGC